MKCWIVFVNEDKRAYGWRYLFNVEEWRVSRLRSSGGDWRGDAATAMARRVADWGIDGCAGHGAVRLVRVRVDNVYSPSLPDWRRVLHIIGFGRTLNCPFLCECDQNCGNCSWSDATSQRRDPLTIHLVGTVNSKVLFYVWCRGGDGGGVRKHLRTLRSSFSALSFGVDIDILSLRVGLTYYRQKNSSIFTQVTYQKTVGTIDLLN